MIVAGDALAVAPNHGQPVHARSDFGAALDREPWSS